MGNSLDRMRWKPLDTSGDRQRISGNEQDFDYVLLDARQLEAFSISKCFNEALRNVSNTDAEVAKAAGTSKGHISKLVNGLGDEQLSRIGRICQVTGHLGPIQKIASDLGFDLKPKRRARRIGLVKGLA